MAKAPAKSKPVKKSGSKTSAEKKPASKSKAGKSKAWESLAKELKSLIPKLDEEGLAFLVKQSNVHIYNMQVDALNNSLIKEKIRENERKMSNPAKKTVKVQVSGDEQWFTEVKKSASGSNYYIVYNNEWIAFTGNEMATIVKIVFAEGSDLEIRERLFNWLSRERSDLLYTASIGDKFNEKLKSLVSLLKSNFKLKHK